MAVLLELLPSADVHLALNEPFTRVVVSAVRHEPLTSTPLSASDLQFEIDDPAPPPPPPNTPPPALLENGSIRIDTTTGEIVAVDTGRNWVWVTNTETVGTTQFDRRVPVRVTVHEKLEDPRLGNDRARVHADRDDLVITVFATNEADQAVDISGHGFVTFALIPPSSGVTPLRHSSATDHVSGAHSASTQVVTVGSPEFYQAGDLLYVERTHEYMRVTAAPAGSPISVERGVGSPATALVNDDAILRLGGVDSVQGRVRATQAVAGQRLQVTPRCGSAVLGDLFVAVDPSLEPPAGEDPDVESLRMVIEPLPYRGDGAPRRNILLVAEGFKADQVNDFRRFARRVARRMQHCRTHEPFRLLREDYRLWMAFLPAAYPGIAVNTRVMPDDGTLNDEPASLDGLLLQVPDCVCGMGYGRRAGEVFFAPPGTDSAEKTWTDASRETSQLLKDWRRLGSRRGAWQTEALRLFGGWRLKEPVPGVAADLGRTWGPGGADQGLVLLLINEHVSAGTFTAGDNRTPDGFLFGALTTRTAQGFTLPTAGNTHTPGSDAYVNPIAVDRIITAVHELAHCFFLGDEYEDTRLIGDLPQEASLPYDNLDTEDRIAIDGVTKFAAIPRVVKSSPLVADATVDGTGSVTVEVAPGEAGKWNQPGGTVSLQTRNINRSSLATVNDEYGIAQTVYSRYPRFRAHPCIQATGLSIAPIDATRFGLTGASLQPGTTFPAGSMLYEPRMHQLADQTEEALSLVLPGVLAYMQGSQRPLYEKDPAARNIPNGGLDTTVTRFPTPTATQLDIEMSPHGYQTIGLYEGGGQANFDVYRPTGQCAMRTARDADTRLPNGTTASDDARFTNHPVRFCHVCRYVIVNEINPARQAELDAFYPGEPRS